MALADSVIMRRLSRNIGGLLLGNAGALLLSLVTTAYLARTLGRTGFGAFSYGQTFAMYGALVADLGLTAYGTRAVARDPEHAEQYLFNIAALQILAGIVLIALSSGLVYAFNVGSESGLQEIVLVSLLWVFPFALNVEWFFLGSQRMSVVSVSKLIQYGSICLITYALVGGPRQVVLASAARVIGGLVSVVWLAAHLSRGTLRRFTVNLREALGYLASSKWFWFSAVLVQVSNGVDILILQAHRSSAEVGIYSASFRLMSYLLLAISLVNTVMFPMLSAEHYASARNFRHLLKLYWLIAGGIAGLLLLIGLPLAPVLIDLVYGDQYALSVPLFRILLLAAAVFVVNGAIAQPLLVVGRESTVTRQILVSATFYVGMNLLLIPRFGSYGAAWVYAASAVLGTIWLIPVYVRQFHK
jgi:O-antigen/teichoic acid export membrane protein